MAWWALIPASVSLFQSLSGKGAGDAASDEAERRSRQAEDMMNRRLGLATWQLDDFKENFLPGRNQMIKDAFGEGPTAYYGQEVGAFQSGMAKARENLMSRQNLPMGQQHSLLSALDVENAKGMASLFQKDAQRKAGMKRDVMSMAYQTPAAVQGMDKAFAGSEDFFTNLSTSLNNQAAMGYQAAAQGMQSLGNYFGSGDFAKNWKA